MKITGKRGVDTAIEAVGIPATLRCANKSSRPAAPSPISGCMERRWLFIWSVCGTATVHHHALGRHRYHTNAVQYGSNNKIDPKRLITHRFKLDQILDTYDTFGNAAKTKALKVIVEA